MNLLARRCEEGLLEIKRHPDAEYICTRVVDTLLREDVRQCVSQGEIVGISQPPSALTTSFPRDQQWLQINHFGNGHLWIPVEPCNFMQPWRLTRLPLLWCGAAGCHELHEIADILACFRMGLSAEASEGFVEFEAECQTALDHLEACELERKRWFAEMLASPKKSPGTNLQQWHASLLHYDRLAAFLDHPLYPTARAKLGFSCQDLQRYAPEFGPCFELNWLAVPSGIYCQSGHQLPAGWPGFSEVGLDARYADTHSLIPVHPFVWQNQLDRLLNEKGLANIVIRAPRTALKVTPTLSVRTLVIRQSPEWHIKLPLTIRTLGGRNIRTIKPSTITDGHSIQSLLALIAERETDLRGRVLLTDESTGAHAAHQSFLGFIVRRYTQEALHNTTLVPVAALAAQSPGQSSSDQIVVSELIERFYDGDGIEFLNDYLELTLRLHLTLWLRYGIALESNQQNSVLVLSETEPICLLLKDNDAARIHIERLSRCSPILADKLSELQDARILVSNELPLAQMFTTITLQLNIATVIETIAGLWRQDTQSLYALVRQNIENLLHEFQVQGEDVTLARQVLLEDDHLPVKYLLVAATLMDKATTGASDVNKYYGRTAPNFLRQQK